MPDNMRTPEPYDYSDDLAAGRADVQADAHYFFDTLFAGCTVLDVGAGLGKSKERITRNKVTTQDIDVRLRDAGLVDITKLPDQRFDVVTAFDVIEHVQDDLGFLMSLAARARRAAFLTTPDWHHTRCNEAKGGSTHHWREYTLAELLPLVARIWKPQHLLVLCYYKDSTGGWWQLRRAGVTSRKLGILWCRDLAERERIIAQAAGAGQGRVPG